MSLRPSRTMIISAGLFVLCASVYFITPVHEVTDSHYSMLLSEHIWRFGSFQLDRYFQEPERHWPKGRVPTSKPGTKIPYHVYAHNGHIYYFYPPGSAVLSIPLVAVEHALGFHA